MKQHLSVIAFCLGLVGGPGLADDTCPWSGGDYSFSEHGIYGDFTVNAGCSELVWSRMADGPETTVLERSKGGWNGALEKANVELLDNGHSLRLTDVGGPTRQFTATRKN